MATPSEELHHTRHVRREDAGAVTTLTLDFPEKFNPLSAAVLAELQAALDAIAADDGIQVVIIAAEGRAFCAGHDLKELRANDRAANAELFDACSRMMLSVNRLPQPVIAAVQGVATAAGCQLVAACDLAVAAEEARFAVSGINLGLFCATPSVALSRNIPRKRAMEMLLTGEFIDAATALDWGLVNRVVPAGELAAAARSLAETVAAKPPVALRLGKDLFYRQLETDLAGAYKLAGEVMACNMDTEDARGGIDAFFDKRKPEWQGR